MRMEPNWTKDPSCRALRYNNKMAVAGVDVFLILQEEEPEMFEQQHPP